MKVGDYVRTNYGISKILKLEDINTPDNIYITKIIKIGDGRFITDSEIIKSSPNIIDLIEVGDFIGKTIVEEVKEFDDGTRIIVMADGFDEYDENEYFLEAGIVTKEQFESMEYKVC